MKWPNTLTILRHGESAFNKMKEESRKTVDYGLFVEMFEKEFSAAATTDWPSAELINLAGEVWKKTKLSMNDYKTPLTEEGVRQARVTGGKLKEHMPLPDIIYCSPYLRTEQTLRSLEDGWPELKNVRAVYDDRIREQEHGLQSVFNDWRVFCVLNPIQGLLFKQDGDYFYRHPNGESKIDVRDRLRSFSTTLIRENAGENVLLISHHLTLLSIRANLERWTPEKFVEVDRSEKPINCGVTIYKGDPKLGRDGKLILDIYNKKLY